MNGQILTVNRLLLAGNALSFVAACFTVAASVSRKPKRIYLYQALQCLILAFADILFASPSGTVTLVLCVVRNLLIAYGKFSGKLCALFLVVLTVLGIFSNTRGAVGLIPVIATAVYTFVCFFVHQARTIKINMIVNLVLWTIYDLFIWDVVSAVTDSVSAVIALMTMKDRNRKEKEPEKT